MIRLQREQRFHRSRGLFELLSVHHRRGPAGPHPLNWCRVAGTAYRSWGVASLMDEPFSSTVRRVGVRICGPRLPILARRHPRSPRCQVMRSHTPHYRRTARASRLRPLHRDTRTSGRSASMVPTCGSSQVMSLPIPGRCGRLTVNGSCIRAIVPTKRKRGGSAPLEGAPRSSWIRASAATGSVSPGATARGSSRLARAQAPECDSSMWNVVWWSGIGRFQAAVSPCLSSDPMHVRSAHRFGKTAFTMSSGFSMRPQALHESPPGYRFTSRSGRVGPTRDARLLSTQK